MALQDPTLIRDGSSTAGPRSGNQDRFREQIENAIFRYGPNLNPLVRMANVMQQKAVGNMYFKVLNDKRLPRFSKLTSAITDVATTIPVANGNYFRPQDLIQISSTKEQCFVVSVSGNDLTVIRNYVTGGSSTGTAAADQAEVRVLAQAQSERSATPESIQTDPGTVLNYLQIISRSTNVSRVRERTEEYGPPEKQRQTRATMDEAKIDAELAFKFGQPIADVEGSTPRDGSLKDGRWSTGGIVYFIDNFAGQNRLDAQTTLTQKNFWDFVQGLYENMPDDSTNQNRELTMLCGAKPFHAVHQWGLTPIRTTVETSRFGIALASYQAPTGVLNLVQDYSLKGDVYDKYAIICNAMDLQYTYLRGLDMHMEADKQMPNVKETIDEIWGAIGLGIKRPELHGYIHNWEAGG